MKKKKKKKETQICWFYLSMREIEISNRRTENKSKSNQFKTKEYWIKLIIVYNIGIKNFNVLNNFPWRLRYLDIICINVILLNERINVFFIPLWFIIWIDFILVNEFNGWISCDFITITYSTMSCCINL